MQQEACVAHVRQAPDGGWHEHALFDHLNEVGRLAGEFAAGFGSQDWAALAGLWHDLGKYSAKFQRYIRDASGYERGEAHIEGGPWRVDHSTAGAIHAIEQFGDHGRVLAYLIAGHHAGLPDWYISEQAGRALAARIQQTDLLQAAVQERPVPSDLLAQNKPTSRLLGGREGFALWIRMLFSCLIDADRLDTERFMDTSKSEDRRGSSPIPELLAPFNDYMERKRLAAEPSLVNRVRTEVLRQCRHSAASPPGVFTLTVPTGGGKTLSSLAFALNHAVHHGKGRVIYVIPYTSIIEQTANIFREIFGDIVVEHHSNVDPDRETAKSGLATENWDAPLIVTTNVQFFESLFVSRTSRARKLHNIVNSVVILDEAQLLEPGYLQPILSAMNLLAKHYGVTFLLSTATQPALHSRTGFGWTFRGLEGTREIIKDPDALYRDLERVRVTLPEDFQTRATWDEIASQLQTHERVLCIVNRRSDCRDLFRKMPRGTIHLSALMCGEHRSRKIAAIKEKLDRNEPVRVISTQLVEAGVDLDFPVVYRAMAGLDSIAQAAGRCNREGELARGNVVVFVPPTQSPPGILRKAEDTALSLLSGYGGNPLERSLFTRFFENLYAKADLDKNRILELLQPDDRLEVPFRTAAARFKLIDDSLFESVFVRYADSPGLLGKLAKEGPQRWLMRKLQRYTVNLPKWQFTKMQTCGDVVPVYGDSFFGLATESLYNEDLGVVLNSGELSPDELVF